jgi:hypothetical protein
MVRARESGGRRAVKVVHVGARFSSWDADCMSSTSWADGIWQKRMPLRMRTLLLLSSLDKHPAQEA